jgi:hypothetical protein
VSLLRRCGLLLRGGGRLSSLFKYKDAGYKWFGIFLGFWVLVFLGFGIDMLDAEAVRDRGFGIVSLGACAPGFMVAAIYIAMVGMRLEKERLELERLAGYLKAYRRIKVDALAQKLALSEYETEKRILRCVRHRLLTGYIDRASDEFFNPFGMEGKALLICPQCGGTVEELVLKEETARCPFCDSVLPGKK